MADSPKQFPSGFAAVPTRLGDMDFGELSPPDWVWVTKALVSFLGEGSQSLAYRLVWGAGDVEGAVDGSAPLPDADGELWLTPEQLEFIAEQYRISANLTE